MNFVKFEKLSVSFIRISISKFNSPLFDVNNVFVLILVRSSMESETKMVVKSEEKVQDIIIPPLRSASSLIIPPKSEEKVQDIIIPPLRNTASLIIPPDQTVTCDIARKQLENLNKFDRTRTKSKVVPLSSEMETPPPATAASPVPVRSEGLFHDPKHLAHNLTSAIVSKSELEDEIRKKIAQQPKKMMGTIEIPQEMILSGMTAAPVAQAEDGASQLHDQELIDILEGKPGRTEVFEVVSDESNMLIVQDIGVDGAETSYEIVSNQTVVEAKMKLLEREIAMRQIASLPMRKNKKSSKSSPLSSQQSVAQSLAAEWGDDDDNNEMILEVTNVDDGGEPKIKILNMTILNESAEAKPKLAKPEPKILNKEAPRSPPKILNINASSADTPATFKRGRVIKKKEIWDPSETKAGIPLVEKKPIDKLPLSLPPSITIKKLTKESIAKAKLPDVEENQNVQKPVVKKAKKRSEIDKLLQDEGAVNMIYSLERENNNEDVPVIDVKPDQKSLIDKSQEKSSLVNKAKAIKSAVMKQSVSPPEVKPASRARAKRDATPVKTEAESVVTKATKPTAAGRKKKADNSWDFMYSQAQATCDDAMIIRRHSNSSYSSSAASPRRLSVDVSDSIESPPTSAKKAKQGTKDAFEFTKPPQKNTKSPADKLISKDFVDELRGKISNELTKSKEKPQSTPTKGRKRAAPLATENSATPAKRASERRSNGSDHKEYQLVRTGKIAHIIFNQNPLSISLLSEMKALLNQLETDDCQVVVITSNEGLSEGLDYSTLVQTTVDKRKQAASDLVTAFK